MIRIICRLTLLAVLIAVWLAFMLVKLIAANDQHTNEPRTHNVVWFS